ncbi:hypothetical protein AVEN_44029-1 [Araneus ventricosus]|uniref:Uncharacterized protein n=1 Tax=Araneus ventricosus TaxID=182803 RepID=A0A4Y2GK23_ARAVE|nr:hypothetical protein AVEN_44029-1 [Araneus ventricosus]
MSSFETCLGPKETILELYLSVSTITQKRFELDQWSANRGSIKDRFRLRAELPLYAKTVKDRTVKMSSNITNQQTEDLKLVSASSIAVDESWEIMKLRKFHFLFDLFRLRLLKKNF